MNSRHAMVKIKCEWCGELFMARKQRVDNGQSRWCSRPHYREWLKAQGSQRKNIGKENAIIQWEESKNMFCAYWYDETMKYHSSGWGRWYWELNIGEVPENYRVGYKDGDSKNASPENLKLKSWQEYGEELGDRIRGVPKSEESKKKMSIAHTGKVFSKTHIINIGNAQARRWANGDFDSIHKGEHNANWRGGVDKPYPKEFCEIRNFVKERDNHTCQICGKVVYRSRHGHVHHIDGNKEHNLEGTLILLCSTCHSKIHAVGKTSPVILAFRSKLEWNNPSQ
jgi:ribosomal protein S27E